MDILTWLTLLSLSFRMCHIVWISLIEVYFIFNPMKYPMRCKRNGKVSASPEQCCRWRKVGAANDSLREDLEGPEFGLASYYLVRKCHENLTFPFRVQVHLVHVLLCVFVLTVKDFFF